jgi:hypothetical protein
VTLDKGIDARKFYGFKVACAGIVKRFLSVLAVPFRPIRYDLLRCFISWSASYAPQSVSQADQVIQLAFWSDDLFALWDI